MVEEEGKKHGGPDFCIDGVKFACRHLNPCARFRVHPLIPEFDVRLAFEKMHDGREGGGVFRQLLTGVKMEHEHLTVWILVQ